MDSSHLNLFFLIKPSLSHRLKKWGRGATEKGWCLLCISPEICHPRLAFHIHPETNLPGIRQQAGSRYWLSDNRHLVNWRQSCKRERSNGFSSFQLHYVRLADHIRHYGNQQMKTILICIENKCKKGGLRESRGGECFPGQPDRPLLRPFNHLLT